MINQKKLNGGLGMEIEMLQIFQFHMQKIINSELFLDFIVYTVDNKLGFFDTKSGITIMDAKEKLSDLMKFLASYNNYFGGLVLNTDQKNYLNS